MTPTIKRYPSVAAMARDARETDCCRLAIPRPAAWFDHETAETAIAKAISGDTARVAAAEKLLSQITAEIETPERPFVADVAGAYPVVAEFLSGAPDCMRRRATVESDAAPVRVFVSVSCAARLTADQMMRRGCAALALVMALGQSRPVELILFNHNATARRESMITVPVETQPIDLATAAFTLANVGFARWVFYNLSRHHAFGRVPQAGLRFPADHNAPEYAARLAGLLGAVPGDIILDRPTSAAEMAIANPVAWVNAKLATVREAAI